jgi:hypothetical protein
MERRNLILTPWISLPFFLDRNAVTKETPKDSPLDSLEFLGTFEGAGTKHFDPLDLADLPEDTKGPKKPPSGRSAEERKKIEEKGSPR